MKRRMTGMRTRKSILNISSRKKQDNMVAWRRNNVVDPGALGGSVLNAGSRYWVYGWIATARNGDYQSGGPRGIVNDDATRTASKCYMRGLKEKIRIETQTGHPFLWRRICFKFTGTELITDNDGDAFNLWSETSAGFVRATTLLDGPGVIAPTSDIWNKIATILFKGQVNVDWSELITAPLDRSRVKVAYDSTVRLTSGNAEGKIYSFSRWHPMNKTLQYNDDEEGGGKSMSFLSVNNRQSMGDYYVIDVFDTGISGDESDALAFTPEATLYWHER